MNSLSDQVPNKLNTDFILVASKLSTAHKCLISGGKFLHFSSGLKWNKIQSKPRISFFCPGRELEDTLGNIRGAGCTRP